MTMPSGARSARERVGRASDDFSGTLGTRGARASWAWAFSGLLALALIAPAHAQLFGDNEARKAILDLRAKVAEVEKQLNDKIADLGQLAARADRLEAAQRGQLELANQIDALKQEIAKLNGRIDALANDVSTVQKRNRDLYTDLDARLKNLEPTTATVDGKSGAVSRDEQAAYDAALVLFRAADFNSAVASLQQFLARYPQSIYVPTAQYWLGNAYYALKDYRNAIAAQQVVLDRFVDSPRAPEAMLNIAASHVELKDRPRAKVVLQKIISDFPDSEAAKVAKDRLASLK
jgi:tol-pal system protein YbgF